MRGEISEALIRAASRRDRIAGALEDSADRDRAIAKARAIIAEHAALVGGSESELRNLARQFLRAVNLPEV